MIGLNAKVLQSHYCSRAPLVRNKSLSLDFIKQDRIQGGIYFTIFYAMTEKTHNEDLNEKKATKVPVENEEESDL